MNATVTRPPFRLPGAALLPESGGFISFWWLAAAGILGWGAWLRFRLPRWPFADPDTWGYVAPIVKKALTGEFTQTYGRDFFYVSFLRAVLHLSSDFRAITLVQHSIALIGGLFFCLSWLEVARLLKGNAVLVSGYLLLGLAALVLWVGDYSYIAWEHSIRPEALFPGTQMLALWATLSVLGCNGSEANYGWRWCLAVAADLIASKVHLTQLCGGLCLVGVLCLHLAGRSYSLRAKLAFFLFAMGGFVLLANGDRLAYDKLDPSSSYWGPFLFFGYHSEIVSLDIAADASRVDPPYPRDFLKKLDELFEVEFARVRREGRSNPSLGFTPDIILFTPYSVCGEVRRFFGLDAAAMGRFYRHYDLRMITGHPRLFLGHIARNVLAFYGPNSLVFNTLPDALDLRQRYEYTRSTFLDPEPELRQYPPGQAYIQALSPAVPWPSGLSLRYVEMGFRALAPFLPLLWLVILGLSIFCAATLCGLRPGSGGPAFWMAPIAPIFVFGVTLAVGLTSSFDVIRYKEHPYPLCIFIVFTLPAFLFSLFPAFQRRVMPAA